MNSAPSLAGAEARARSFGMAPRAKLGLLHCFLWCVASFQTCQVVRKSCAQSAETVRDWTAALNTAIRQGSYRPRKLLVFLNPYGGAKRARQVWQSVAQPIFDLAGAPAVPATADVLKLVLAPSRASNASAGTNPYRWAWIRQFSC